MKSPVVYKELTGILGPRFKSLGFQKIGSSRPKWVKQYNGDSLHVYLSTHKHPWEPYAGCSFIVEVYVCPSDTPVRHIESDHNNSESYFGEDLKQLEEIQEIGLRVLSKVKKIDLANISKNNAAYPDLEFLKLLHQSSIESMESDLSLSGLKAWFDPWLFYLELEDVTAWSEFISSKLEQNIARIEQSRKIA